MTDPAAPQESALPDHMQALEEVLAYVGGPGALAKLIDSAISAPSNWRARGAVPSEQAPNIEFAVYAKLPAITAERLCPTAKYVRVPDESWPNPAGKPLLDPVKPEVKQADHDAPAQLQQQPGAAAALRRASSARPAGASHDNEPGQSLDPTSK